MKLPTTVIKRPPPPKKDAFIAKQVKGKKVTKPILVAAAKAWNKKVTAEKPKRTTAKKVTRKKSTRKTVARKMTRTR